MEVYLDNAATTRCYDEAASLMAEILTTDFGNPSSLHAKGVAAEGHLRTAKEKIAATLKCKPSEIFFTSGGTESDNLALFGIAHAYGREGHHIAVSAIEHPAVLEAAAQLEKEGFAVSYILPDAQGLITPEAVKEVLRDDTVLVSVMHVNNEIGTVEPVAEIAEAVHAACPKAFVHVDAVQGYGKVPLFPARAGIDLMSVSGHKIHGPKGVGFLYVKKGVRLIPLLFGGGQQASLRPGTENVAGYAALALAAEKIHEGLSEKQARMASLRTQLIEGLFKSLDGITVHGMPADAPKAAPHILNIGVTGIRAEVLLHALEEKGIYVSSGSACSSNHPKPSGVLQAIGVKEPALTSAIRLSFSEFTTADETEYTLKTLCDIIPVLRRFQRQ